MGKWQIQKRGSVPLHILYQAITGCQRYSEEFFGAKFAEFIYFSNENIVYYVYGKKTLEKLSKSILDDIAAKSDKNFKKKWSSITKKLLTISWQIINTDLIRVSRQNKLKLYRAISDLLEKFHAYTATSIDLVDITLSQAIKKELASVNRWLSSKKNLTLLTAPVKTSFLQEKELDLLKLALSQTQVNFQRFQKKYLWVNFGWQEQKPYTLHDALKELQKIKLSKSEITQKILQIKNGFNKVKKLKHEFLKKIGYPRLNHLVEFSDHLIIYHDDRKYHQMIALYAINKILKSIKEYQFEDLLWCKTQEIICYLKNDKPIDLGEINRRKQGTLITILNDHLTYQIGSRSKAELMKMLYGRKRFKNTRKIKGVSASPGKAQGKARIIFDSQKIIDQITKNDILVTSMTTPDFVPIMKKVAAIVTDEGGITCHAAIISRELGIPCIIGTKIATDVLKDGDLVEVDANKGIVKILTKNNTKSPK